jgi:two-component system OmpR family response regulator
MPSVLVVDDDPMVLRTMRRILAAEPDLDVSVADSGEAALRLLDAFRFDVVLLDIMMPGLQGYGVLELMGDDHPPVIAMSALSGPDARAAALAQGCVAFIDKPFSIEEVVAEIRRAVRKPR